MNNYLEYIILPTAASKTNEAVDCNWPADEFAKVMKKLTYKNLKYYEKKIKQYVKDSIYYEVVLDRKDEVSDIRSYVKTASEWDFVRSNILKISYNKNKQPIHSFSSSRDLNDITYIKRLTFRVSNRVFINFESGHGVNDGEMVYRKIFINANIDSNVDTEYINAEIDQYLHLLA